MRTIKYLCVISIVAFIEISPCVYAGELSIELSERLYHARNAEYISAIVHMADRADPNSATKGIFGRNKALRLKNVIRELRSTAQTRQDDLIVFLEKEKSLGNVLNYTSFWIFNGLCIKATPAVIEKISSREDVEIINLDIPISLPDPAQNALPQISTLQTDSPYAWNIEKIHAPEVWEMGYDGTGVMVGVFDMGADITHPDIAGKYRGGDNSWFDPYGEYNQPVDHSSNGHGTHVTGTILGGNASGKHIGVAPGAHFIAARCGNDAGDFIQVSDMHRAFQWLMDPDGNPETDDAPDVINNSWDIYQRNYMFPPCQLDLQDDMRALRSAGIISVFAAGNSGPFPYTSASPATYPEAISVGMTNPFDKIAFDSSRGPNNCDLSIFPDLCAPGSPIFSSSPNEDYKYLRGTSMATPHVTGVIALMLDANPDLTVDEIESILKTTAKPLGIVHPNNTFGWGRVDALAAVNEALALE